MSSNSNQKIGFWVAVSLVVGNMIGTGVFTLPNSLANYGSISFFGWIISSTGAIALALVFGYLSKLIPKANGGPYIYTKKGIGPFSSFLVAWGYWISVWVTNAAISIGFAGYLAVFIPEINQSSTALVITASIAIWFLVWVNSRGIKNAGYLQLITSILKITPLFIVSISGLFFLNFDHFIPMNLSDESDWSALASTSTLTLFALLGVEAATIPAAQVENPERNVSRATIVGTVIVIAVYIIGSMSVMGIIPPEQLATSSAPFADAAAELWGENARYLVAAGAIISAFGALNGWILIMGQIPAAVAMDNLFPKIFARKNKKDAPALGIVIGGVLATLLLLTNSAEGFSETFRFFILLATLLVLLAYLLTPASYLLILIKQKDQKIVPFRMIVALIAFAFAIWAVIGSGKEVVYYGFIMLMLGIPVYVWMKIKS